MNILFKVTGSKSITLDSDGSVRVCGIDSRVRSYEAVTLSSLKRVQNIINNPFDTETPLVSIYGNGSFGVCKFFFIREKVAK